MRNTIIILALGLVVFLVLTVRHEKRWDDIETIEAELDDIAEIDSGIERTELEGILVSTADIEGHWKSQNWHDGINLRIEQKENGQYAVECEAWGDLSAGWIMNRTATVEDGVLTLDKPIREYSPTKPYRHFYLINTPDGLRLSSPERIRNWILASESPDWGVFKLSTLKRIQPDDGGNG